MPPLAQWSFFAISTPHGTAGNHRFLNGSVAAQSFALMGILPGLSARTEKRLRYLPEGPRQEKACARHFKFAPMPFAAPKRMNTAARAVGPLVTRTPAG